MYRFSRRVSVRSAGYFGVRAQLHGPHARRRSFRRAVDVLPRVRGARGGRVLRKWGKWGLLFSVPRGLACASFVAPGFCEASSSSVRSSMFSPGLSTFILLSLRARIRRRPSGAGSFGIGMIRNLLCLPFYCRPEAWPEFSDWRRRTWRHLPRRKPQPSPHPQPSLANDCRWTGSIFWREKTTLALTLLLTHAALEKQRGTLENHTMRLPAPSPHPHCHSSSSPNLPQSGRVPLHIPRGKRLLIGSDVRVDLGRRRPAGGGHHLLGNVGEPSGAMCHSIGSGERRAHPLGGFDGARIVLLNLYHPECLRWVGTPWFGWSQAPALASLPRGPRADAGGRTVENRDNISRARTL